CPVNRNCVQTASCYPNEQDEQNIQQEQGERGRAEMKNVIWTQAARKSEDGGFVQGVKDCLPTVLGYLSIGFAAGVVERTAGFSLLEIALLSLLLYAGSAQFITAGMMMAGMP